MEKLIEKTDEQTIIQAFASSDFYQLLSLSLQWPSQELANALMDGSYQSDAVNILQDLQCSREDILHVSDSLDELLANESEQLLGQMRKEYTRLFNHPVQPVISIYESMFTEKVGEKKKDVVLFLNPTALDVERCYKEAGIHLTNSSKEPADHMAAELEFMMYLHGKKGIALKVENLKEVEKIEENIDQFERLHLLKWVEPFLNRLENESEILPYKRIAKLAEVGLNKVLLNPIP